MPSGGVTDHNNKHNNNRSFDFDFEPLLTIRPRLVWPWQIMFENRGPKRVFRIHHVSEPDSTGLGQ